MADPERMQLARFLAKAGVASRRACDELLGTGRVSVNGQPITSPATRVDPAHDRVTLDGKPVQPEQHQYILLNKPAGYTCTLSDRHAERLAIDLLRLPDDARLFSVGRLDRDSEGLLLFTNDGELAHRLAHPRYGIRKTYQVDVRGTLRDADLPVLLDGIEDDGETLRALAVDVLARHTGGGTLRIVVGEGRKREIRRMCHYLGYRVERLVRTHFGPLSLDNCRPAQSRPLTPAELQRVRKAVGL